MAINKNTFFSSSENAEKSSFVSVGIIAVCAVVFDELNAFDFISIFALFTIFCSFSSLISCRQAIIAGDCS